MHCFLAHFMSQDIKRQRPFRPLEEKRDFSKEVIPEEEEMLFNLLCDTMQDVADMLALDLTLDLKTIEIRYRNEGLYFITALMPALFKAVLKGLESHTFTPVSSFGGMRGKRERLPAFLQGLLCFFFRPDGTYHAPTSRDEEIQRAQVLSFIETICCGWGHKYEAPISDRRFNKQTDDTIKLEETILSSDDSFVDSESYPDFLTIAASDDQKVVADKNYGNQVAKKAQQLIQQLMSEFDPLNINPKHGPGSTFDTAVEYPHEKYYFDEPPAALEEFYPKSEYFNPSPRIPLEYPKVARFAVQRTYWLKGKRCTKRVASFSPDPEYALPDPLSSMAAMIGGVSRGTIVNKNAEKGRGISMELKELMYIQKGVQDALYAYLEDHPLLQIPVEYLTPSMIREKRFGKKFSAINFTDQTFNARWALISSGGRGRLNQKATLDLTEASRYVSTSHVAYLFHLTGFRDILLALRSRYVLYRYKKEEGVAERRESRLVKSKTYAPMGSAVCFPIEAIVFWAICSAALSIEGCQVPVCVYGDDLLVPARKAESVMRALEILGLKVNRGKSFYRGPFRESCGVNAVYGVNCNAIVRAKKRLPFRTARLKGGLSRSKAAACFAAWIAYSNRLFIAGLERPAERIRAFLKEQFPKESRALVYKTEHDVTGRESYLYLIVREPEKVAVPSPAESVVYQDLLNRFDLLYDGVQVSDAVWSKARLLYDVQYSPRVRGVSVHTPNYRLGGEDHGFTDSHALLRWMNEGSEDSRLFATRNTCYLKIDWHVP